MNSNHFLVFRGSVAVCTLAGLCGTMIPACTSNDARRALRRPEPHTAPLLSPSKTAAAWLASDRSARAALDDEIAQAPGAGDHMATQAFGRSGVPRDAHPKELRATTRIFTLGDVGSQPVPTATPVACFGDNAATGGAVLVYQNTGPLTEYFPPGANDPLADDLLLAGSNRELERIRHVCVFSPGPGSYSVTMQLWTDDAGGCGPLSPIPMATCFESSLPPGTVWDAAGSAPCDFGPNSGIVLPNKVWLVVTFSTNQAGWMLAYQAEVGSTDDVVFSEGACFDYGTDYSGQCAEIHAEPAPVAIGACCDDGTGVCTPGVTQASCQSAGDRFGGAGSTCSNIEPPCVVPTGACCDDGTGVCTPGMTQANCQSAGDRFGGIGSTCASIQPPCVPPPTGACCRFNGTCAVATQAGCAGAYLGHGTACDPSVGACCLDRQGDEFLESCVSLDQVCCGLTSGTFHGPGSSCGGSGACCYDANGDCFPESCGTAAEPCCNDSGGAFLGVGSSCLTVYGDIMPPTGNGVVDLDDILCVLDDFANQANCSGNADIAPCAPNGVIDLDDILAELDAFAADYACPVPCPASTSDVEPPKGDEPGAPCSGCGVCDECVEGDGSGLMDPVYLFSGEFHASETDLVIRGRGLDFDWVRKYRSKIGPATALGNGWDYSYNIRLEASGPHLILHDGNTRDDTYKLQPDGSWSRREFFRSIKLNPDGSYTMRFLDTGAWNFHALDAGPRAGKIAGSVDRNGNSLTFDYDVMGRLVTVHDTLDTPAHPRDITIAYNADGFIASVTDFVGRSVTYDYYDGIEPGGNFGDLKSATTPAVVNTPDFPIPPGHEYPAGKTTVYTYSTGFADSRLNHNLLTITDSKGQTYLVNEYDPTTDPGDLNFDRLNRQRWGDPGDIIDLVYVPQVPAPANNFATIKVIYNDRVGNVKEFFYDSANRGVIAREYTGRANPDQPTTETLNRPTGKLRPDDPDYFETRFGYNTDSRRTRVIHPNGNEDVFTYDAANPVRRAQGNMLSRCHLPGPLGGDQTQICEFYEYDDDMGGCCGTNFVTRHTDARGNETLHTYDANGNRTHTQDRVPSIVEDWEYNSFGQVTAHIHPDNGSVHRRRDEYTYYSSGPQTGYLHQEIIDAAGFALTTTYEYDDVGNVTRTIDPRGHDAETIYNQLNQPVRSISREVTDGSGTRYETDTFYDANDNVVRVDVQNRDETGALQPNSHFTTIHEYDILDSRTRTCTENGVYIVPPGVSTCDGVPMPERQSEFITTETDYDANRNPIGRHSGEAVENRQPDNVTVYEYDERDLVFRESRAPASPDQSTTQTDYDGNANVIRRTGGIEDALNPRITITEYDGYDRVIRTADPMGNETIVEYDANGNRVSTRGNGELLDIPGAAGNVRLFETTYEYDAMDRLVRLDSAFFDSQTQLPIGDGFSTTITEYTDNSQVRRVLDDHSHQTVTVYDTANRRLSVTDHKLNSTIYVYDADSNVVTMTQLEKSDLGSLDEAFVNTFVYDNLDRLIRTVDPVGNTFDGSYDSRDNRTKTVDALRPVNPTDPGNVVRYAYDGLNRLVATTRSLTADGTGTGAPLPEPHGIVTTTQSWDDNSRLTSQTDDNGNATRYAYDALNRRIVTQMADGTLDQVGSGATWPLGNPAPNLTGFASGYDVHHNRVTTIDANGSVVTVTYDLRNRQVGKSIVPGPGVANAANGGTTSESYQYDGLSRVIRAQDNDSVVARRYDSLSNVTRETQNQVPPFNAPDDRTVVSTFDGGGNKLTCTYPGGRIITTAYDVLDRKKTITDTTGAPQLIAQYDYVGPDRVQRRDYGNGTRTQYSYDGILPNPPNDFGVRSIVRTTHTKIVGGAVIDDRTFTWDRIGNKTKREDLRVGGPLVRHDYTYDSIYRLIQSVKTPPGGPGGTVNYALDGVGNRTLVVGGPDPGLYTMDLTLPEPGDRQSNQYTTTPPDGRAYDRNGNLISIDPPPPGPPSLRTTLYDYRNQMVRHTDSATNIVTAYAYDALGRRIRKIVDLNGVAGGPTQTRFYLEGWQEIEEQNAAGATVATYVFGLYIDEVLTMRRDVVPGGGPEDYYYHTDDLYNVMAVSDAAGNAVERYEYEDYGRPSFFTAAGAPLLQSQISNLLLFTGRRYDPETAWYCYRTRYLDPTAGRFTARDTIGIWGDADNLGNGCLYAGNNPWTLVDPFGESPPKTECDCNLSSLDYYGQIVDTGLKPPDKLPKSEKNLKDGLKKNPKDPQETFKLPWKGECKDKYTFGLVAECTCADCDDIEWTKGVGDDGIKAGQITRTAKDNEIYYGTEEVDAFKKLAKEDQAKATKVADKKFGHAASFKKTKTGCESTFIVAICAETTGNPLSASVKYTCQEPKGEKRTKNLFNLTFDTTKEKK